MKLRGLVLVLAIILSGCVGPSSFAPASGGSGQATDDPSPAEGEAIEIPLDVQTVERSGIIVVRPTTNSRIIHLGDAPHFILNVPPGTQRIDAHAEWSPPQQMGLEFKPPGCDNTDPSCRIQSWGGDDVRSLTTVQGPIVMEIKDPLPGEWYVYLGPGIVGGLVEWTLTLRLTLPSGEEAVVNELD